MEPLTNMGLVCSDCTDKRKALIQQTIADLKPKAFIGSFVKLAFPAIIAGKSNFEFMWVKVTGLAEHVQADLRGELNNDPAFADCVCGDRFEFSLNEIVDIEGLSHEDKCAKRFHSAAECTCVCSKLESTECDSCGN